jgi:hypothetical protein
MVQRCIAISELDERELFRQMIHDKVDKWVDQLSEVFEEDRQPTLMEMSELFTKTREGFLGGCLQALIELKYADLRSKNMRLARSAERYAKRDVATQRK